MEHWLYEISVWAIPLLLAITLHEAAHGYAASRLGDDTALRLGRVTLNPLRHVDPFGTVILPGVLLAVGGFLFGWAKPVPVNFGRLRKPRWDMIWVALAGPGTNIALAVVSAGILSLMLSQPDIGVPGHVQKWVAMNMANSVQINLILAVFNMLPLPPLDGGRVLVGLLPRAAALKVARLEDKGILILIALMFLLPFIGSRLGMDLNIFRWIIGIPTAYLADGIFTLVGMPF